MPRSPCSDTAGDLEMLDGTQPPAGISALSDGSLPLRLVVVTYHYPTDLAVGGLRWAGLTKYLSRRGWRTWIVTAAPADPASGTRSVVTVPAATTLRERLLGLRATDTSSGPPAGQPAPTAASHPARLLLPNWLRQLRRELGFLLSVPDETRGWILPAAARTRALLGAVRPHAVVSSGPPHSAHLAALLATRFVRVPWFVDVRDPWARPIADAWKRYPRFRSPIFRRLNIVLEHLVMRSSAGVICNTRDLRGTLRKIYPRPHFHWVPNGCDRERLPRTNVIPFPGMALVHVGTVYGGRDLTPVVRGMHAFISQHPEAATSTSLRIAGELEPERSRAMQECAAAVGLESCIEFLGRVPQEEALLLVARSRVAIVLAQQQQWQVPAKLYELAAMGIPTLVLAEQESASANEARRLGALPIVDQDVEGIAAFLHDVWCGRLPPTTTPPMLDYADLAEDVEEILLGARRRDP